ncbi:sensor domain-containing diguanylate cyclase [uncultured Cohaesibacter sp.]|uniref:sensor domain-containing diguanylate cyclase n=1 Tax=uncultured Cohaesibacter sp. TaxID=1002546 RepID=UPI00292D0ABD|nr:sensor domain-containing diguanylate cyclase [uncultured Cohaesibacter sp.]
MDAEFYRSILDVMSDGVYFVNRKRQVLFWNKAAEELSGYRAEEILGKCCAENTLNHVDDEGNKLCKTGCPLAGCMRDGVPRDVNVYMHHKSGYRVPVHIRSFPMRNDEGKIIGSVEVFSDNSNRLAMLSEVEALRQDALIDPLSGIGNRRFADVTLENMEENLKTNGVPYAVLFIDIDHFKSINDTWGHQVGDRVIATVSRTLTSAIRAQDVACRWGGDEYVVLLPHATEEGLVSVGKRIMHLVQESWFQIDGRIVSCSASLGGAVSRQGEGSAAVVARADEQLYVSKSSGRGRFCFKDQQFCIDARPLLVASS